MKQLFNKQRETNNNLESTQSLLNIYRGVCTCVEGKAKLAEFKIVAKAATVSPVLLNHHPSPTDEYPKSLILSRDGGTGELVIQYYPIVQVFHKEDILLSVSVTPSSCLNRLCQSTN